MAKRLLLINPRTALPGYYGAEVFEAWGMAHTVGIADLATVTIAALAPADWQITICDEHVSSLDLDADVDFVGLTGKITQAPRMLELARTFRARGKVVLCGGPYASLSPDVFRGQCDVLVTGELEDIAPRLFADLEAGCWQSEYHGGRPDLKASPLPRWELYPNDRAMVGCVQTSRGCPFDCEFCDVIAYLGRKQRHKPVDRVIAELDALYAIGYRNVFLADDNFTVYRRRAKELLEALGAWNRTLTDGHVSFITQVSIDAARDPDLLRLCAAAGLYGVFIGIETPNEESLIETRKRQNIGLDLIEAMGAFLDHGISVTAGMIVGFDHDGPDIFRRQFDFAMMAAVPVFTLGALVAPAATPLYQRMKQAGRLVETGQEIAGVPWDSNIVPAGITPAQMRDGLRWLCNALYRPDRFTERTLAMIERLAPHPLDLRGGPAGGLRPTDRETALLIKRTGELGKGEAAMLRTLLRAVRARPHTAGSVMTSLFRYAQIRHLYETGGCWEPSLVG